VWERLLDSLKILVNLLNPAIIFQNEVGLFGKEGDSLW